MFKSIRKRRMCKNKKEQPISRNGKHGRNKLGRQNGQNHGNQLILKPRKEAVTKHGKTKARIILVDRSLYDNRPSLKLLNINIGRWDNRINSLAKEGWEINRHSDSKTNLQQRQYFSIDNVPGSRTRLAILILYQ